MGDMSAEPSMEDILSSIKRIIAEEGDGSASPRVRRTGRSAPAAATPAPAVAAPASSRGGDRRAEPVHALTPQAHDAGDDEDERDVLELRDRVQDDEDPAADAVEPDAPAEPILSESAAEASRGALDTLSRMIVKPAPHPAAEPSPVAETLEHMVREMLRPMLREWLDAKLPGMVEDMVAREIARITKGR